MNKKILREIEDRKQKVYTFLTQPQYAELFNPSHLNHAVYSYINMGGKSLRPVVLMLSCAAVGGEEYSALPAAAAIEVYHTWTLVHDDIIDRDNKRRGAPTVHSDFTTIATNEMNYTAKEAEQYGLSVAILTGDVQHAWAILMLTELTKYNIKPELVLALIAELSGRVSLLLAEGEVLDVQYAKRPIKEMSESQIIDMLWKKTGILYEFAGRVGAAIGRGDTTLQDDMVTTIGSFCSRCGTAFQLQDDILGIVGNEDQLGKPVGSDIREGKRTTIVLHAFRESNKSQKMLMEKILGNIDATEKEIKDITTLFRDLGGITYTQDLAKKYIEEAITFLKPIPSSKYKDLLLELAQYMIDRKL